MDQITLNVSDEATDVVDSMMDKILNGFVESDNKLKENPLMEIMKIASTISNSMKSDIEDKNIDPSELIGALFKGLQNRSFENKFNSRKDDLDKLDLKGIESKLFSKNEESIDRDNIINSIEEKQKEFQDMIRDQEPDEDEEIQIMI